MPDFFTPEEIADRFRVHARTVRRLCVRGELRGAVKVGRQWRIPASAVSAAFGTAGAEHAPVPAGDGAHQEAGVSPARDEAQR